MSKIFHQSSGTLESGSGIFQVLLFLPTPQMAAAQPTRLWMATKEDADSSYPTRMNGELKNSCKY